MVPIDNAHTKDEWELGIPPELQSSDHTTFRFVAIPITNLIICADDHAKNPTINR
jgi:hypothetical protein